jgi:hypothetical protein
MQVATVQGPSGSCKASEKEKLACAVLTNIALGRDMGTEVEVVSGLTADDSVIVSPPDSLISGETVRVVTPPAKGATAN